ncbi:MAG: serine hydrolase [Oligoflexia bacterium]|nr:serine hydrolase [Oligoflexia bacterium]
MKKLDIPYYQDYISDSLREQLLKEAKPYSGVEGLVEVGNGGGLEDADSLNYLCELYRLLKDDLGKVLNQRIKDRDFIDKRVKATYEFNEKAGNSFTTSEYKTIIGLEDEEGRIVIGPYKKDYYRANENKVADLPEYLKGNHVTLFGPPDSAKLSINAMNAFHRAVKDEPAIVSELLEKHDSLPKWGADDEDSKTPLRADLASAGENLTKCFAGTLRVEDKERGKVYELAKEKLSLPIKRFPGLALPSSFLFLDENPIPLHLYDFALHFFHNWRNPQALSFYVPKLENEEEARYIKTMMETAEKLIKKDHPEYEMGSIRLLIVLENPRAVFRVNELMDELYPYFAGASLGWHDYLGSTARLMKEDPNYRIPVKADPDIVIKHIKGSHQLLADVVGPRGGIKIGGMYGILPIVNDIHSDSFQITIFGFIKDVVTQLKRGLDGFWVAHPDFMRIGLALVEAWKQGGDWMEKLVKSLLHEKHHQPIMDFINGDDIQGLNYEDELYDRDLIVADIAESNYIKNNDPEEIRYNVFQSLQYITDWLSGNGCVALPAIVGGEAVRVMDDLATAERSRWEVWHEIYHGRFSVEDFLKIAHEEMNFIRKDLSNEKKIVQVKYDDRTAKWYPIAMKLMIKLMTDKKPVEFATELLLPFGIESVRKAEDPWQHLNEIDEQKYKIDSYVERFNYYFEMCGCIKFAKAMAKTTVTDLDLVEKEILSFNKQDILDSAFFHGNIGESKKGLDHMAKSEQSNVSGDEISKQLLDHGQKYLEKFGMKFLVSAKGKSGEEMLTILKERFENTEETELENARAALFEITKKRINEFPLDNSKKKLSDLLNEYQIAGASLSFSNGIDAIQALSLGELKKGIPAKDDSLFEIASLSKTIGSALAIEYFTEKKISLHTKVNDLLRELNSDFLLKSEEGKPSSWADLVEIHNLMSHSALNMHYVNGVPANREMPTIDQFLFGNDEYGYEPISVINEPGTKFKYSGAGFIVLEYLLEQHSGKSIKELSTPFLSKLGLTDLTFNQSTIEGREYASGHLDDGTIVEGERLMFPAFAAGAMSSSKDMLLFLNQLARAYQGMDSGITYDTAVKMLTGTDKGCQEFMGADMGLGVFIARAGDNKLAMHQGANDGFRSIYVHCFDGPDLGKGFALMCNGDNKAVVFMSRVAQEVLKILNFEGINTKLFKEDIDFKNIPQEELVNFGYKNMVFNSFEPTLPEAIIDKGPIDELMKHNLLVNAEISEVTNQKFARAQNLISPHSPVFDPTLFGKEGKIMDSWESVRHNLAGVDSLILSVPNEIKPKYLFISTKWHYGNHAPAISIFGKKEGEWRDVLKVTKLDGHSYIKIKLDHADSYQQFKICIYPDGGLSRVGIFDESLPEKFIEDFKPLGQAKCEPYKEEIPKTSKPLHIPFEVSEEQINQNLINLEDDELFDCASAYYGGKILSTTNEHYGPTSQVISPFPPISMFDGFESARSRTPGHQDEFVIGLHRPTTIHQITLDFTYFVNNNPLEVEILAKIDNRWEEIVPRENVKGHAGKKKSFSFAAIDNVSEVKVVSIPDGGMNRVHVFSRA